MNSSQIHGSEQGEATCNLQVHAVLRHGLVLSALAHHMSTSVLQQVQKAHDRH